MKLENKVAIVTGAASGMGEAIAKQYAIEGAKVVVSDLNLEGAERVVAEIVAAGGTAFAIKTDVSVLADVEALFEQTLANFETLDILVNNAGIMDGMEPVGNISDARWDKVFAVNTTSVMYSMRLAVPIFLAKGQGIIINNTSVGGLYGGRAGAAYVASKHATNGLTKNTAFMYGPDGIRCNAIAPGGIATNIASSMTDLDTFGAGRQATGGGLMPRFGLPEEIATVAVFLASDDSKYINGQVITVDGGWTAY